MAVSGLTFETESYDDETGLQWDERLRPLAVNPSPNLFELPARCPKDVSEELRRSFTLFWNDPAAAANRVRTGVELLLDSVGVPRRQRIKGKLNSLSLHARIQLFSKREPVLGAQLLAVKWIGNAGSHSDELNQDDLLDAFEILEHVLNEVVDKRSKRIAELAKQINKRKGPRARKLRRK